MADPHNIKRYGELYNQDYIDDQLEEIKIIRNYIILSGGWAWHFISPPHKEYKHLHDHKDIDIFVGPREFTIVQLFLTGYMQFHRVKTKYDNNEFIRYEKIKNGRKIIIDMFKSKWEDLPSVMSNGFRVVDPKHLITLYKTIHQTSNCVAAVACQQLIKDGEEILNNEKLIEFKF